MADNLGHRVDEFLRGGVVLGGELLAGVVIPRHARSVVQGEHQAPVELGSRVMQVGETGRGQDHVRWLDMETRHQVPQFSVLFTVARAHTHWALNRGRAGPGGGVTAGGVR
ncbi:hypothetical protein [Kitasatospora sp. NPDC056531]|uniref:hypothetical protein n=1 Tax=Kitasatospora sp. NPDC056531 TaxID=3345856 RepID=UPI0036846D6A